MEKWKPFAGGYYEVSDRGRVRRAKPGKGTWRGRILALSASTNGYLFVRPNINGKTTTVYLHQVVATVFIGPCPKGLEVNHKDLVKTNNTPGNLEYMTHVENIRHAIKHGLGSRKRRFWLPEN